jgi:hypothetical protein
VLTSDALALEESEKRRSERSEPNDGVRESREDGGDAEARDSMEEWGEAAELVAEVGVPGK